MKPWLSKSMALALRGLGLPALSRAFPDTRRAVILRYHSVSPFDPPHGLYRCDSIAMRPETFAKQMRFLSDHYRVRPLPELIETFRQGTAFPKRTVAITFDDGYRDNLTHALPILRQLGLPATIYVTTDSIGNGWKFWLARLRGILLTTRETRLELGTLGSFDLSTVTAREQAIRTLTAALKVVQPEERREHLARLAERAGVRTPIPEIERCMLDWQEMRHMLNQGITFGAHTRTHPNLKYLADPEHLREELAGSRAILEQGLSCPIRHMAFPNGTQHANHCRRVARAAAQAGFLSAVTSVNAPTWIGDDPLMLNRVGTAERHGVSGLGFQMERDRIGLGRPQQKVKNRKSLLMVGPPADARTGIASCVRQIQGGRLAERLRLEHLSPTGPHGHYALTTTGKGLHLGRAWARFLRLALLQRPAAIQVHTSHYGDFWRNLPFMVVSRALRIPLVVIIHGSRFDRFLESRGWLGRRLLHFGLRSAETVLVRGRYWQRFLQEHLPGQRVKILCTSTVVPEEAADLENNLEKPVILFVGGNPEVADAKRKGLPDLLAVLPEVLNKYPEAEAWIVGPRQGPPWTDGLGERIRLLGTLPPGEVQNIYARAALSVLPSHAEGMPNVVLEAMARGLPVLATNVGSTAEILLHGKGGRIIPPGDRQQLQNSLCELLKEPKTLLDYGRHNRQRIRRRFSDRKLASDLLRVYRRLLFTGNGMADQTRTPVAEPGKTFQEDDLLITRTSER